MHWNTPGQTYSSEYRIKNFVFPILGPQRSTYKRMKNPNKEDMTIYVEINSTVRFGWSQDTKQRFES